MRILTPQAFLAILLIAASPVLGQSGLDQFFDKYAGQEEYEAIQLDAELLKAEMSNETNEPGESSPESASDADAVEELLEQFDFIQVLSAEFEERSDLPLDLFNEVHGILEQEGGFEDLIQVFSNEVNVKAVVKGPDASTIEELVAVVQEEGEMFVFFRMSGELNLAQALEFAHAASEMHTAFDDAQVEPSGGEQSRVGEPAIEGVTVFPNPSEATFNISYKVSSSSQVSWYVVDASARVLETSGPVTAEPGQYNISWTAPAAGLYTLVLETENGRTAHRLSAVR